MGVGNPEDGEVQPQLFNDFSVKPPISLPLAGWVQKAEVWLGQNWTIYAACCLFILIRLVCLTGEVTWFKVYELSLLSADSWLPWLAAGCSLLFCC